jgi:galactokinase
MENGRSFGRLTGDEGVGTLSGNEDQTAIFCSRPGEISQYQFCPVRRERSIALGPGWTLVVAASGVPSDKTGGVRERFNRLALSIATLRDLWNRENGRSEESLFAAVTRDSGEAARFRSRLRREPPAGFSADFLLARLDQLVEESAEIIPLVGDLLERGDAAGTGPLVDRSQELAEKVLGNQVAETVALQRSARGLGAAAASAFGGGFGGSVWALVETTVGGEFLRRWQEEYVRVFPARTGESRFFLTRPEGPAMRIGASGAHPWKPAED